MVGVARSLACCGPVSQRQADHVRCIACSLWKASFRITCARATALPCGWCMRTSRHGDTLLLHGRMGPVVMLMPMGARCLQASASMHLLTALLLQLCAEVGSDVTAALRPAMPAEKSCWF